MHMSHEDADMELATNMRRHVVLSSRAAADIVWGAFMHGNESSETSEIALVFRKTGC